MSAASPSTFSNRKRLSPALWLLTARRLLAGVALCALLVSSGCSRFRAHIETQYVYVIARQAILRDRVAAVSNRVGEVTNGEKLQVLERTTRFVKVKTANGTIGWLEARLTADQALADQFEALRRQHQKDPVVATATATDDVYLHISPGRETDRFYRLAEGAPVSLLARATVLKPVSPGAAVADAAKLKPGEAPPPPPMEDWWLVRGAQGQTGWLYSHLIDVAVPETIARYAEGQRIVGAYVLATVDDPESGVLSNGQTITAIPEYVSVLNSGKSGLPYDFDQLRVFNWNLKKHRYETSFRERNIMGYLPVKLFKSKDPYGKTPDAAQQLPTFSYTVLAADAPVPVPDPKTGEIKPARLVTKTYRLEGNICRRLLPPNTPAPDEAHPTPETKKEKQAKAKRKH
jgi:SH3-like domain-containing protein